MPSGTASASSTPEFMARHFSSPRRYPVNVAISGESQREERARGATRTWRAGDDEGRCSPSTCSTKVSTSPTSDTVVDAPAHPRARCCSCSSSAEGLRRGGEQAARVHGARLRRHTTARSSVSTVATRRSARWHPQATSNERVAEGSSRSCRRAVNMQLDQKALRDRRAAEPARGHAQSRWPAKVDELRSLDASERPGIGLAVVPRRRRASTSPIVYAGSNGAGPDPAQRQQEARPFQRGRTRIPLRRAIGRHAAPRRRRTPRRPYADATRSRRRSARRRQGLSERERRLVQMLVAARGADQALTKDDVAIATVLDLHLVAPAGARRAGRDCSPCSEDTDRPRPPTAEYTS